MIYDCIQVRLGVRVDSGSCCWTGTFQGFRVVGSSPTLDFTVKSFVFSSENPQVKQVHISMTEEV